MTFPSVSDICRATADGDLTLIKILVSRGAPVDSLCQAVYVRGGKHFINGWPPVRVAAKFSQYRVLQFLLDLGTVDTNRLSLDDGRTALHDAVELGNLLIIDMLLKDGADPMIRDFDGKTSMDIARLERNTVVVEILLEAIARPAIHKKSSTNGSVSGTGALSASSDLHYPFRQRYTPKDVWVVEREKVSQVKYSGLDDIVFETNLRESSPLYSSLLNPKLKTQSATSPVPETGGNRDSTATTEVPVISTLTSTSASPIIEQFIKQDDKKYKPYYEKYTRVKNLDDSGNLKFSGERKTTKYGLGVSEEWAPSKNGSIKYDDVRKMASEIVKLQDEMKAIKERLGMVTGNKADEGGPPRASKTPKEGDSVIVDELASQSNLPPVPVLLKNNKYLARYPVPQDKRPWNVPLEGYAPIMFSAPELFTISRHNEESEKKLSKRVVEDGGYELKMCYYPPIWADPELYGMTHEDRQKYFQFNKAASIRYHPHHGPEKSVDINRVSYLGDYELHPITGAPLNPNGRTGMIGRGLLGKYGPNHAADPIVTCLSEDKSVLQLALIKRQDTGQFALPGGMVDPGEHDLSGTAVREFCEEALEGNDQSKLSADERKKRRAEMVKRFVQHKKVDAPIISKVVNDPRNTDNAWMETQAFWFHFPSQDALGRKLQAGDDAVGAAWVTLDESFDINILYADHPEIVIELFRVIKYRAGISEEFEGLVVPDSIKSKL